MVICVKCGKEQARKSGSGCNYDLVINNVSADKSFHAWEEREEFINELREKLPPVIRERIAELKEKNAKNQALFKERMETYNKKLNELQAAYSAYLNEELPQEVENKKQSEILSATRSAELSVKRSVIFAKRLFIFEMIGSAIGVVIGILLILFPFKWLISIILNMFGLKIHPLIVLLIIVLMLVYVVYFIRKPIVKYLKTIDCAKSQSQEHVDKLANEWVNKLTRKWSDKLARKWSDDNKFDKLKSDIEHKIFMEKRKFDSICSDFENHIKSAERALGGNDEDLLCFYNMDKQAKIWYIGKIYDNKPDRAW